MECPICHKQTSPLAARCASCGGRIPPGQYLLEEAGVISPKNPAVASPVVAHRVSYRVATLGDRCIAAVLDTVVLLGAFVVVAAAAFFRWGVAEGAEFKITAASLLIATGLNVLIMFAYFCLLEATFGATLGKTLVGIRVVNNGRRHSWSAAAIRNALRMLDGIGFYALGALVASCSKGRQRLGDLFAGTIVVEHDFSVAAKVSAMLLWFASLIAAGWGIPGFLSENRPAQLPPQYLSQTVMQFGRIENSAHIRAGRFRIDFRSDSGAGERVHVAEPAAAKCGEGEGLANPRGQNAAGRIRQSAE